MGANIASALTVQSAGPGPPGRGEPVHTVAANLGDPLALAVASSGDIYVTEQQGLDGHSSIVRVTPAGTVSTLVRDCPCWPGNLAFDAAGNLLTTSYSGVYSVSPTGAITQLIKNDQSPGSPVGIAVAPDGTIWIATFFDEIRQYDKQGQ